METVEKTETIEKKETKKTEDPEEEEVKFEDGFEAINKYFKLWGLHDVYKAETKTTKLFQFAQKIIYASNWINVGLLVLGEFVLYYVSTKTITEIDTFLEVSETTPCTLVCILGMSKSLMMFINKKKIVEMVDLLRSVWPETEDINVKKIINENLGKTTKFCLIYIAQLLFLPSSWHTLPIYTMLYNTYQGMPWNHNLKMPYIVWYPFDYTRNWWTYLLLYLSQISSGWFVCCLVACVDSFFCTILGHLCMHFKILQREIITQSMEANDNLDEVENNIKKIVEKHLILIKVAKILRDCFHLLLFVSFFSSTFLICLQLLCAVLVSPVKALKYIFFVITAVYQIALLCFYGDKLKEESEAVGDAAYNSEWPDANPAIKNCIRMIQIRSSKPVMITTTIYTPITLATFSSIMNCSWSYFTLLRSVME